MGIWNRVLRSSLFSSLIAAHRLAASIGGSERERGDTRGRNLSLVCFGFIVLRMEYGPTRCSRWRLPCTLVCTEYSDSIHFLQRVLDRSVSRTLSVPSNSISPRPRSLAGTHLRGFKGGCRGGDRGASRVSGFVTRCPVGRDTWARRAPVRWGWIVCNGHLVRSDLRRDLKEPIHEGTRNWGIDLKLGVGTLGPDRDRRSSRI